MIKRSPYRNVLRIPEGWTDYSSIGKPISGTKFIAMKVPLREEYLKCNITRTQYFSAESACRRVENLGMVIDLTNTDKYYDPIEFKKKGIRYHKLKSPGHVIPDDKIFQKFCTYVDDFLEDDADDGRLIAVHCTHGLNRTGYLICRYMIQVLKISPSRAIDNFNTARGHPITRKEYIEDLMKADWSINQ